MPTTTSQTSSPPTTAQVLVLAVPAPGQTVVVTMQPAQPIEVPFDMSEANVTLVDGDLLLEFPGEAVLLLKDFAAMVEQGTPPRLTFSDGSVVAGDVLLAALISEPVETAAGSATGSGDTAVLLRRMLRVGTSSRVC